MSQRTCPTCGIVFDFLSHPKGVVPINRLIFDWPENQAGYCALPDCRGCGGEEQACVGCKAVECDHRALQEQLDREDEASFVDGTPIATY